MSAALDPSLVIPSDLVRDDQFWRLDPGRPYVSLEPGRPWGVILIPDAGRLVLDGRRFGPVFVPPGGAPTQAEWQGARVIREIRVVPHAVRRQGRNGPAPIPLAELSGDAFKAANPLAVAAVDRLLAAGAGISVAELARMLGCSQRHLIATVRAETGLTPALISRLARLDAAHRAVWQTGTPLADIALAHGFTDQAHLTRLAKTHWGLAPGALRSRVAYIQDGVEAL